MEMLEIPVTLIVKAPNQQVEDQTIHCSLSWTIKKLKGHLSEVYPSKPNTEDQRLIYYGQLLHDSVTLKDVFTRYEADKGIHTVHLVCVPSKDSIKRQGLKAFTSSMSERNDENRSNDAVNERLSASFIQNDESGNRQNNDGVRQRFVNEGFVNGNGFPPWMNPPTNTYDPNLYMQQMAWMQHAYANYYMTQYMEMVQRQNNSAYPDGVTDPRQRAPNNEVQNNVEQQQPLMNDDDEDVRGNRDWLDYFYITSRLLVLFSIVYFYSSPARLVIVSTLGIILYMYQIGFFRPNQMHGLDNNNEVLQANHAPENNNLLQNEEAPAGVGARVDAQEQAAPVGAEAQATPVTPPANTEAVDRPSFLALTWTFFTTFFSSMIPETQNPV